MKGSKQQIDFLKWDQETGGLKEGERLMKGIKTYFVYVPVSHRKVNIKYF